MLQVDAKFGFSLAAGEPFIFEVQFKDQSNNVLDLSDREFVLSFYRPNRTAEQTIDGEARSDVSGPRFEFVRDGTFSESLYASRSGSIELAERLNNGKNIIFQGKYTITESAPGVPSYGNAVIGRDGIRLVLVEGTKGYVPTQSTYDYVASNVPDPEITLGTLSLTGSLTQNVAASGVSITGATTGSTIALSGAGSAGLSVSGSGTTRTVSGTPSSSGTLNAQETLADATNSPNTSNGIATVAAAPALGTLSLSGALVNGTPSSGTITGATSGSTITSNVTGLTVNSGARTYTWDGTGSAGATSNGLVETLSGATGSPKNNSITVTAAAPTLGALSMTGTLTQNTAASGVSITGATAGSTITLSGAGSDGLTVNGSGTTRTISGTPTTAGTVNAQETLSGATNSPRTSNGIATVGSAPGELLLVAGQSLAGTANVTGATGLPSGWTDSARVQMWSPGAAAFVTYSPSTAPANDPANTANTWGPETAYAAAWLADAANNGKTLYIVKHWQGGSQLGPIATYGQIGTGDKDWTPATSGGNYPLFRTKVNNAKAALATAGVTYTIRDLLWVQGETDSRNSGALAAYSVNAAALYSSFRSEIGTATTNIVAHYVSQYYADYPRGAMAAEQKEVADLNARNYIVDTYGFSYQSDQIHLLPAGTNSLGTAAYQLLHGTTFAPASLQFPTAPVADSTTPGTVLGQVSASLDGKTTYSIIGSTDFEIVGTDVRVASGATLTAGTKNFTVRAVNAGGTVDFPTTLVVQSATSIFLNDLFNMPADQTLTAHAPDTGGAWLAQSGGTAIPAGISTGDGIHSTGTQSTVYNDVTPPEADYYVEIEMVRKTAVASQSCGPIIRAKGSTQNYYGLRFNVSAAAWEIIRATDGQATATIGTAAATLTLGQTYVARITCIGNNVFATVDGAEIINVANGAGPTTAGFAGVRITQTSANNTGFQVLRITAQAV